jgi:hypothetical protein
MTKTECFEIADMLHDLAVMTGSLETARRARELAEKIYLAGYEMKSEDEE